MKNWWRSAVSIYGTVEPSLVHGRRIKPIRAKRLLDEMHPRLAWFRPEWEAARPITRITSSVSLIGAFARGRRSHHPPLKVWAVAFPADGEVA